MRFSRPNWVHTSTLLAALLMVVVGLVLCRLGTPVASSPIPDATPERTTSEQVARPVVEEAASDAPAPTADEEVSDSPAPAAEESDADAEDARATGQTTGKPPAPAPAPRKPAPAAAPKPRASARKAVPQSYLPPFQPGAYGTESAAQSGPPPDVLWLSGVIQGEPMVAVLRRGSNRFYVRQGDTIENGYTVVKISSNAVTLRRARSTRVLRLGQY